MSDTQNRIRIELDISREMASEITACLRVGTDRVAATEEGASALYDLADAIARGAEIGGPVSYVED